MSNQKLLLISHLAINDTNNVGKTLFSIFNKFNKNELIQLFFNPILPNVDRCKSWYQIKDMDIVKSLYSTKAGKIIDFGQKSNESKGEGIAKYGGKTTLKLFVRDLLWKVGRINRKQLNNWLKYESPTAIFLAPGYNCFPYKLARSISKNFDIPTIIFLMDDFYFEKKNKTLLELVRRKWLQFEIKKTIKSSRIVYTCSEEMAKKYSLIFEREIEVLYTPYIGDINIKNENYNQRKQNSNGLRFIYAGSLGLKRWEILLNIGNVLSECFPHSYLTIYANENYKEEINSLTKCKNIQYGGFINSEQLNTEISKSDVVLHVESFDSDLFTRTRYSITTKIPECLASGKIFLAIGPKGQSGIEYLKRNQAAFVCDDKHCIRDLINEIHGYVDIKKMHARAKNVLIKNHNVNTLHARIINSLDRI